MKPCEEESVVAARKIIATSIDAWFVQLNISNKINCCALYKLTLLKLEHSGLRTLPPAAVLGSLPCLQTLSLNGNKIRDLNGGLKKCQCLTELSLDDNYLESVDGELCSLHCLQALSIKNNCLTDLKAR